MKVQQTWTGSSLLSTRNRVRHDEMLQEGQLPGHSGQVSILFTYIRTLLL